MPQGNRCSCPARTDRRPSRQQKRPIACSGGCRTQRFFPGGRHSIGRSRFCGKAWPPGKPPRRTTRYCARASVRACWETAGNPTKEGNTGKREQKKKGEERKKERQQ